MKIKCTFISKTKKKFTRTYWQTVSDMLIYNQKETKETNREGEENNDEVEKRNAMLYVGALL